MTQDRDREFERMIRPEEPEPAKMWVFWAMVVCAVIGLIVEVLK